MPSRPSSVGGYVPTLPVTLVWWQKNYDGLVDKSEVVLTPNNPLGTITDQKQLEERIAGSVVVEE